MNQQYSGCNGEGITSAGYLKEIIFLEFLENTSFNFNKLVGHQKSEKCVIIGVYGDIERY
jgi:hypothetical protein